MINVARHVVGSIGVTLARNVFTRRLRFHTSPLAEAANPSNLRFAEARRHLEDAATGDGMDRPSD